MSLLELGFIDEDSKNHSYYNNLCEDLLTKPFRLPIGEFEGGWVNWFSGLRYTDGIIEYRFDPILKPFLLELKGNFTKYRLNNILALSSSYSIHIYELLSQTIDRGGRTIYLDEFREILGVPNTYANADIKRLLNKTQKDLKDKTNILFLYSFEKEGRKFNKINFKTSIQKKYIPSGDLQEDGTIVDEFGNIIGELPKE